MSPVTTFHTVKVPSGTEVHYAASGSATSPPLVLLHGYPTSINQFRNLIPLLADKYHVLAPDLPGFGFTKVPANHEHSFANIAAVIGEWLDALSIKEFSVYIFDYGAPTAFRIALQRPNAIKAIISQNGNAYEEGFGPFFDDVRAWWASGDRNNKIREAVKDNFQVGITTLYKYGTPADRLARIDPATYTLDYKLNVQGKEDIQADLLYDYQTNVALYPQFHAWLREKRVPVLAVWGKNDTCFVPAGAEAFKKDTDTKVVFLDGGHFLLETHLAEATSEIRTFLEGIKY